MSPDDDPGTGHSVPVDTTWATACKAACMNDSSPKDGWTRCMSICSMIVLPVIVLRVKLGRTVWRIGSVGWGSGSGKGWPRATATLYMSRSGKDCIDGGSNPHAQYVYFPFFKKACVG